MVESAIGHKREYSNGDGEAACPNYKNRLHTTAFKYPGNGCFNNALNWKSFSSFSYS